MPMATLAKPAASIDAFWRDVQGRRIRLEHADRIGHDALFLRRAQCPHHVLFAPAPTLAYALTAADAASMRIGGEDEGT